MLQKISITLFLLLLITSSHLAADGFDAFDAFNETSPYTERQFLLLNIGEDLEADLIMDMMDANQNKVKDKILAVLLEVKFKKAKWHAENGIRYSECDLIRQKKCLPTCTNQNEIQSCLRYIESTERYIQKTKESLNLIEKWEEQYCY